jgi:hypothetical protein
MKGNELGSADESVGVAEAAQGARETKAVDGCGAIDPIEGQGVVKKVGIFHCDNSFCLASLKTSIKFRHE